MTDLKAFLSKLNEDLNILREREAKYGGNTPLELINQIGDYKQAVSLTEQTIAGNIAEANWQTGIRPLALSSALLDMAAQITPDLQLHERAYRQRLKEHFAEDAPYYIPLAGETSAVVSPQTVQQSQAPRSAHRRRSRAQAEYREWIQAGQEFKRVKLNTLQEGVDKYPCIILLGEPGSGKTTSLENLAYQFADEPNRLPLALPLNEFGPGQTVEDFIVRVWGGSLDAGHWGATELAANLENYLEAGKLFVLFDALNEMPHQGYAARAQALRRFIDHWSVAGNHFLVTCRVLDYGEELSGLQRIEIQPLNDDQIKTFLQNELPDTWQTLWSELNTGGNRQFEIENRQLLELARNPYLLTMMIDVFAADGQLGQNRVGLMSRFTQILMEWAKAKCAPEQWLEAEVQVEALAVLAFEMQDRIGSGTVVETGKIKTVMPSQVQTDPNWPPRPSPPDQVLKLAADANIIEMPVDRSSVRFYHQLLQEYFTAKFIVGNASKGTLKKLINNHLTDDRWREVFLLTASLLDDADLFFTQFRQAIDSLIEGNEILVKLLSWIKKEAVQVKLPYKQAAKRGILCIVVLEYAIRFAYDSKRKFEGIIPRNRDIINYFTFLRDFNYDFDTLELSTNELALIRDLARDRELSAYELALIHNLARDLFRNLVYDLPPIHIFDFTRDFDLHLDFDPDLDPDSVGNLVRNLDNMKIIPKFRDYLEANILLTKCLNLAYVSDRQAIEDSLLSPPGGG